MNTQENAWDLVWNSNTTKKTYSHNEWRDERADDKLGYFLQSGIQFNKNDLVLDAGCGDGSILYAVGKHFPVKLIGVDFSQQALDSVEKNGLSKGQHITTHKADTRELPFQKDEIDKIFSLGVIEHLPNPQKAVDELARCLRPGGTLVLMTPNKKSFGRIDRVLKQFFGKWHFGYQTEFSNNELELMAKKAKLTINQSSTLVRRRFQNDGLTFKAIYIVDSFMRIFNKNWGFYSYVFATK